MFDTRIGNNKINEKNIKYLETNTISLLLLYILHIPV